MHITAVPSHACVIQGVFWRTAAHEHSAFPQSRLRRGICVIRSRCDVESRPLRLEKAIAAQGTRVRSTGSTATDLLVDVTGTVRCCRPLCHCVATPFSRTVFALFWRKCAGFRPGKKMLAAGGKFPPVAAAPPETDDARSLYTRQESFSWIVIHKEVDKVAPERVRGLHP